MREATELPQAFGGSDGMIKASSRPVLLDEQGVVLLDEALKTAYTRLIDSGALRIDLIPIMRDLLVRVMVPQILHGEKDVWRLARRGIFTVCAQLRRT